MDTRLLKHYETELAFLREMGAEFGRAYPKIAARLGLEGLEVLDPYVERLLEGVAFLNARTQLELELQFPAFASHLLDILYPHFLAPTPSMMVAHLVPDMKSDALQSGAVLPRHTQLRSGLVEGAQSACVFRTAHDLTLWPLEIAEAEYIGSRGDLVAAGVVGGTEARAGIRLRLKRPGAKPVGELDLDRLTLFLGGEGARGADLYELFCADCTGVTARSTDRRADWVLPLDGGVVPVGLEPEQALLPLPRQSYDGYRLLQEYFAMPERFHFAEIRGLSRALARAEGDAVDIYVLLRHGRPEIAAGITPQVFHLNCVPAINLFEKRCDRILIGPADHEHRLVVDRTAPLDYEVHTLLGVTGIARDGGDDTPFRPFYSATDFTAASGGAEAYYTVARRMRQRTERERLRGARTNYLGSEAYLALVDAREAPYSGALSQLAVRALVTNRDLPLLLASGAPDLFHLPDGGPVARVETPVPPTRPRPTLAQGEAAWRLVSHLSLNYLSITDDETGAGAAALRELIGIYAPDGDRVVQKQLDGIASVTSRPIVRRMSDEVISTAVRGLEIRLACDEDYFEGASAYLLAAVLERFFRHHVPINSFTETVLTTEQRGEVARWRAETGRTRLI